MHYVHGVDGVSGLFPIPTTENSRVYHREGILYYMRWVQRVVYFSLPRLLPDLTVFIWVTVTRCVSYKKQELLTLREHVISLRFYGGVSIAYLFSFCLILLYVFTFWVPCSDVRYDFRKKTMFVRLYFWLFVGRIMSYLRYLCLLTYSGVQ